MTLETKAVNDIGKLWKVRAWIGTVCFGLFLAIFLTLLGFGGFVHVGATGAYKPQHRFLSAEEAPETPFYFTLGRLLYFSTYALFAVGIMGPLGIIVIDNVIGRKARVKERLRQYIKEERQRNLERKPK